MKIAEVANSIVAPKMPTPTNHDYTIGQTWWWFCLGLFRAIFLSLLPLATWVWNWLRHWDTPIEWSEFFWLAGSIIGPVALQYWIGHRHLLKLPHAFELPPEFAAGVEVKTTTSTATVVEKTTTVTPVALSGEASSQQTPS